MSDVTSDLMRKVAADVTDAIGRTLAIAPKPWLPIAAAAAGAALGPVAFELDRLGGTPPSQRPSNDNILLAGLIAARLCMSPQTLDPIGQAYKDYAALLTAGLAPQETDG